VARIINTDSAGKIRGQLTKAIVVALRRLSQQQDFGEDARDLAAFIALSLATIHASIDPSVTAWEKRGYWVKADRFRMEWAWTETVGDRLARAILDEDGGTVAQLSAQILQRLKAVRVSPNARLGTPWTGAYQRLRETSAGVT